MKTQLIGTEILFENKWLMVKKALIGDDKGNKVGEYIYQHAPWSNGEGVAILLYQDVHFQGDAEKSTERQYFGRYEICPAHSDQPELCSITGGMDKKGESPIATAIRELEEEAGYTTTPGNLHILGTVNPSKAADTTMHLFAVKVGDCDKVEATGDGTVGEAGSYMKWVSEEQAVFCKDPLVATMIQRLKLTEADDSL